MAKKIKYDLKPGDLVVCCESKDYGKPNSTVYTVGKIYKVIRYPSEFGSVRTIDDQGNENGMRPEFFIKLEGELAEILFG
jgi:hypothetical protein